MVLFAPAQTLLTDIWWALNKIMRDLLPKILATITQSPRYHPEIQWSNLWSQNLFRAWEFVFGRKLGIRAEGAMQNGVFYAFSWEARVAHTEFLIRKGLKVLLKSRPRLVWIPIPKLQPAFAGAGHPGQQFYRLAVAFDTGTWVHGNGSNPAVFSYTATGSHIAMLIMTGSGTTTSAVSFNAAAMSNTDNWSSASYDQTSMWSLLNAAAGAHNVSVTNATNPSLPVMVVSYSGVDNTLGINAHSASGTTGTNRNSAPTTSFTTTQAGCWAVGIIEDPDSFSGGTNAITTMRVQPAFGGDTMYAGDSNGGVGAAGSYTVGFSTGFTFIPGIWGVALLQVQASPITPSFFIAMLFS